MKSNQIKYSILGNAEYQNNVTHAYCIYPNSKVKEYSHNMIGKPYNNKNKNKKHLFTKQVGLSPDRTLE